jgi:hypothetical protein
MPSTTQHPGDALRADHSNKRPILSLQQSREYLGRMLGDDMHANRVVSIANGVAGVLAAPALAIHAIGQAYARLSHITPKSGVKQVDRLLSNDGVVLDEFFACWVPYVVAQRRQIVVAMDWTEFDADDHSTLCIYLVTTHGRATPLYWRTVTKSALKGQRTAIEQESVVLIDRALPDGVRTTLLADRGFGDQNLYEHLRSMAWDFIIRFRSNIQVEAKGETRPASEWVSPTGRARKLDGAFVTQDRYQVPAVVVVHAAAMKDSWCLATSRADWQASMVVKMYGRRFTIEETFRDTKDLHFGMGLKATHIKTPARRDRLLLLVAVAHAMLTLLGAAAEAAGLDRYLKANTVKRRTHSLYRQGRYWCSCLPDMRLEWFVLLVREYDKILRAHAELAEVLWII